MIILLIFVLVIIILMFTFVYLIKKRQQQQEYYYKDKSIHEIQEHTLRQFFPDAQFELWDNHYVYLYHDHHKYFYKHVNNDSVFFRSWCHDCINNYVYFWFSFIHPWIMQIRPNKNYYFVISTWDGTIPSIPLHSNQSKEYETIKGSLNIHDYSKLRQTQHHLLPFYHSKRYIGGFCRQINEPYALCILDPFFVETHGFHHELSPTGNWNPVDIPWTNKINKIIYRGDINNGNLFNFIDPIWEEEKKTRGHRYYLYHHKKQNYQDILDMETDRLTPHEMSKYKYQLDIDGVTNSWGGLIWKLQSGSIVFKQDSIWEQWFHYKLQPFIHYIPINNDLSNLREMYEWCETHQHECLEIIHSAREFAKRELTFENALQDMKFHLQSYFLLFDDL